MTKGNRPNPNPKSHSYSRIKTFARDCERKAAWQTFEPWKSSEAAERGSHVHDALEKVSVEMLAGSPSDEAIDTVKKHPPTGSLESEDLNTYLDRSRPVFEHITPVLAEEWFDQDWGGAKNLVGKIDLVSSTTPIFKGGLISGSEPGYCVLDFKTTGRPSNIKTPAQARKSIQLAIYALAASELLGKEVTTAGFLYYLPSGAVQGTVITFKKEELRVAKAWIRGTILTVDRRWERAVGPDGDIDFTEFSLAEPGHWLCSKRWCAFWERCIGRKD